MRLEKEIGKILEKPKKLLERKCVMVKETKVEEEYHFYCESTKSIGMKYR